MGFITTFSIYNDGCDNISKNPEAFSRIIYEGCIGSLTRDSKTNQVGLGCHANLITVQVPRHADAPTFYFHYGNSVFETQEIADSNNLDLISKTISYMQCQLKFLKEKKKQLINKG